MTKLIKQKTYLTGTFATSIQYWTSECNKYNKHVSTLLQVPLKTGQVDM